MADRQVQIEFANIKLALERLLQSSITIMEEVQDQNPATWEQLQEMMMNAADSGDWNERMHNLVMSLMSSLAALGNVNVSSIQLAILHSSLENMEEELTRLMLGNPKGQALIEAIQNEVTQIVSKPEIIGPIFHLYADVLINIIPNLLQKNSCDFHVTTAAVTSNKINITSDTINSDIVFMPFHLVVGRVIGNRFY